MRTGIGAIRKGAPRVFLYLLKRSSVRVSKRVEFRMNTSSELTWMKAASSGFEKPRAASRTPVRAAATVWRIS
jgi:hypothetical protein